MKFKYVLGLFLLLQTTFAQKVEENQNQFIVTGSVELKEVADQAVVSFRIKGVGASLRQAVESAGSKTKELTDKIIGLGVKSKNISTSEFFSGENYGDKSFLSSNRDYRALIETSIKIDSLKLLQSIIFTISEAEVEYLSQINFSFKDELGLRRRARIEAGLKAKEKAEDIAKALGATIGKVLFVEEILQNQPLSNNIAIRGARAYPNPFNPSTNSFESNSFDETRGSGFFAQTISVTSQVRVIFEIK
ncbi:MAG: SIMPL domain-containing protein [Ignavibacteriales bacterium]|nr:SIMPL domain-containing protein [Ignavibacteriales bacterium]